MTKRESPSRRSDWQRDPRFCAFVAQPLEAEVSRSLERLLRDPAIARLVVLPDVHLAGDVCVGCVIATRDRAFPEAVGGDIGCGVTTLRFAVEADRIANESVARTILERLPHVVPIQVRSSALRDAALPTELEAWELSNPTLENAKRKDGRAQFGTLGRGNHFLEFQRAESDGALHVSVHSGSRALGPLIRDHALRGSIRDRKGLPYLPADSAECERYRRDAAWATAYARASRRQMLRGIADLVNEVIGSFDSKEIVDCDHNHVAEESHEGVPYFVHRKGALRAMTAELGIIPGSMGTRSFLVEGRGDPRSLASSSHGAGRELPRGEASRTLSPASVRRSLEGVWFDESRLPDLLDEAPAAYKDIEAVMRAQRDLVRIVDRLDPVLSWKGG